MLTFPNALLTIAKRPAPGQTKTRLTPPLTQEQAATLYECFLYDTLDLIRSAPALHRVIVYLPEAEQEYFATLAPDFELILQAGADLGARLDSALTHFLQRGYTRVVIMDSDSPTLPVSYLNAAFAALTQETDVVLGPCDDGGYYLIGLRRPAPRLLREVQMSTSHVVADTLALAREEHLSVHLLPTWYDIDNGAALTRLARELDQLPARIARHTRTFFTSDLDAFYLSPAPY